MNQNKIPNTIKAGILLYCLLTLPLAADLFPIKIVLPGNWADPTVTKLGDTYYLSASNGSYEPSSMIFQSKDLKKWEPIAYAVPGSPQGLATDISAYGNRLFLYGGAGRGWVTYADAPYENWAEKKPVSPDHSLPLDAAHVVGKDGSRFLYTGKGIVVQLSDDGLTAITPPVKTYDGWEIPERLEHLDLECICLESPKLFWKGDYVYMVSAIGGTAGPATSHMAIVARAPDVLGPWENSPYNPVIWTPNESDDFWSKGHATFIEGPEGNWFAIYHGYLHDRRFWGRATLISPLEWTEDGWPVASNFWPNEEWENAEIEVEWPYSDEFNGSSLGIQWQAFKKRDESRYSLSDGKLGVKAIDVEPCDSNPLTINPGHLAYEVETSFRIEDGVDAGIILYYNHLGWITFGVKDGMLTRHLTKGIRNPIDSIEMPSGLTHLTIKARIKNQDVAFYYKSKDGNWQKWERSHSIQGLQHNVLGGFVNVRPGLYATGKGKVEYEYFRYSE